MNKHVTIDTLNIEPALYFITELESIRKKREAGLPKPWTNDPILRDYSFCNVERERDRVTKHIAAHWRKPHADDPNLWFAMAVARLINWPETLDELGYPVPFVQADFKRKLLQRKNTTFGPAYEPPMCNTIKGMGSAEYLADTILPELWSNRASLTPKPGTTLSAYSDRLLTQVGIGNFIAGQIIADLKYVEPLRSAPDWKSFVISGPGSKRGLNRIMGRPVDASWTDTGWQSAFRRFEAAIRPELKRIGMGDLSASDLQNVLCEVSKMIRTKLGEGKPKRRYPGS